MTDPAEPTYVACLTPPGTGAIATLALHGPRGWPVVRQLFRPRSASGRELPAEPVLERSWLGRLGEEPRAAGGDEVVLVVKQASPGPRLEIHCHGGREVVRYLLEILTARGMTACSWQELEHRTAERPGQAEALAALAAARTARTAGILLDQYHGVFDQAVAMIRAALEAGRVEDARSLLQEICRHEDLGRHLTAPWRVVLAGAPNVGKSSLLNTLAGFQRSIVAATPGTTRDVVTTVIAVDGWPVELADTAGLRQGGGSLEMLGMDLAQGAIGQADLCLWILDGSQPPIRPELTSQSIRYVVNKIDLPAAWDVASLEGVVQVSARTGTGLENLCQALAGWLVPEPPPAGAAVPFTSRLGERLRAAYRCCLEGRPEEALDLLLTMWSGCF